VKEYVLAQFMAEGEDIQTLMDKLKELGDDYLPITTVTVTDSDSNFDFGFNFGDSISIDGKISSAYATLIKLRDPFLAERMQISYIPEDLKNKYRK